MKGINREYEKRIRSISLRLSKIEGQHIRLRKKNERLLRTIEELRIKQHKVIKIIQEWDVEPCCHGISQEPLLRKIREVNNG